MYVIDQWPAKGKKFITKRFIYVKKVYADGAYETPRKGGAPIGDIAGVDPGHQCSGVETIYTVSTQTFVGGHVGRPSRIFRRSAR